MTRRIQHDYPIEILFDWAQGPVDIPLDWTPAQADEMVTILGRIEERIWTLYGDDLVDLASYQNLVQDQCDPELNAPAFVEDDIPF
jgi:hypothetical protein